MRASALALLEGTFLFAMAAGSILGWPRSLLVDWGDLVTVLAQAVALSLCCILAFYYNNLYDLRIVRSFRAFTGRLFQFLGGALVLLATLYALFPETGATTAPVVSRNLLIIVGLLLAMRAILYGAMRKGPFAQRVLILAASPLALKLIKEIEAQPALGFKLVGVADDATNGDERSFSYPLLGPLEYLGKIIEEVEADRLIIALSERRGRLPVRQLLECQARGLVVEDGVETYERLTGKLAIESLTPSLLLFSRAFKRSRFQLALRRAVSVGAAGAGLLLAAPAMAVIALAIKLDSPGPVFFIQTRAGRHARPFRLIKFRTMHERVEPDIPAGWERDDHTRITRVGWSLRKFRLDELPQFWNILNGDMDLVGPRPEMACNVKSMTEQVPYYSLRHVVRPGITGWAQVRHGYSVSLEEVTEKLRYDLYYVKHMSLWLDLAILLDTVKIVLFGRGAR